MMAWQPQAQPPTRLPSEEVIISAPMSYAGSAQRIMRLRRRAPVGWKKVAVTGLAVVLVGLAWLLITVWYLVWGFWLVPYRLLRRGARKRKAEAMRHRELLGTIQGSAGASAAAIVAATAALQAPASTAAATGPSPNERITDADRERAIEELRGHMLLGRLTPDEFEERIGSAHAARTRADLDALSADLPRAGLAAG
jgi:hypothetical protein